MKNPIELVLGPPLLTDRSARRWRMAALGIAALIMVAGWLTDPTGYALVYGTGALIGYLLTGGVLNLLTVLPTLHVLRDESMTG